MKKSSIKKYVITQLKKVPIILHAYSIINAVRTRSIASLVYNIVSIKKRKREMSSYKRYEDQGWETFFGYYDKSPLNPTKEFVVFHSTPHSTKKKPDPQKPIYLIVQERATKSVIFREKIFSYNWQQGCKPQWVEDYVLIYNNYKKETESYISILYNIKNHTKIELNNPIYEAASNFALSLNFRRLAALRPDYGYFNLTPEILPLDRDGIFYIDYNSKKSFLQLSISEILKQYPIKTSTTIIAHKVNHIMLSPSKTQYLFLHRYFVNDLSNKYDRLFLYDLKNDNIQLLKSSKMISHYSWINENTIIVYMRHKNNNSYFTISIDPNKDCIIKQSNINKSIQYGDGHPSVKDQLIISDSYPQFNHRQHLFIYDEKTDHILYDKSLYHNPLFVGECRCDLHPKWSVEKDEFFIESIHEGKRFLYSKKML